ncbi:MAG: hypothetical protein ACK4YU_07390 [Paracoccus sp. (in: a-proteobacteria)]
MPTEILQKWLEEYLPGLPVQIVDAGQTVENCICVALVDLAVINRNLPPPRVGQGLTHLRLTYRVTAPFARPQDGHRVLCDIIAATQENPIIAGQDDNVSKIVLRETASAPDRFGPQQGAGLYLELITQRAASRPPRPPVHEP